MTPPRSKPDDPFDDDDWSPQDGHSALSDEVPEPRVDPGKTDFLKPYHLKKDTGTLELIGWGAPTNYSEIVLNITVDGKPYRLGFRDFDKSFIALRKKFGSKKPDWHGTLRYKVMPHKGNPRSFVAVRPQ